MFTKIEFSSDVPFVPCLICFYERRENNYIRVLVECVIFPRNFNNVVEASILIHYRMGGISMAVVVFWRKKVDYIFNHTKKKHVFTIFKNIYKNKKTTTSDILRRLKMNFLVWACKKKKRTTKTDYSLRPDNREKITESVDWLRLSTEGTTLCTVFKYFVKYKMLKYFKWVNFFLFYGKIYR